MKRILVVQLRELGDCLLATPVIRQLKRLHPDAAIDLVCEERSDPIFRANPNISTRFHWRRHAGVGEFLGLMRQVRRHSYDMAVDCQSLPKTALLVRSTGAPVRSGFRRHLLCGPVCYTYSHGDGQTPAEYASLARLRLLKDERVDPSDLDLDFPLNDQDREEADSFCRRWLRPPVVAISAAGRATRPGWPDEKFVAICDRLAHTGFQPFLVYGPGEEERNAQIAASMNSPAVVGYPMISFPVLKGVLERCNFFVGNNGGAMHVAWAARLPMVAIFRGNPPIVWTHPTSRKLRFLAAGVPSRFLVSGTLDDDRGSYFESFEQIGVDKVWAAIDSLLSDGLGARAAG